VFESFNGLEDVEFEPSVSGWCTYITGKQTLILGENRYSMSSETLLSLSYVRKIREA
jgi:hypothetical protein